MSLPFPTSRSRLRSLAHGLFLRCQSQWDLSDFAAIVTSPLTLALVSSSYEDPCGHTAPSWTISKPFIAPAKSLLTLSECIHRFGVWRHGRLQEA